MIKKILGLDNSTKSTGWSFAEIDTDPVVKDNKHIYNLIDYGLIKREKRNIQEQLAFFEQELNYIFDKYKPDAISAEQMFVSVNRDTARILALLHGVMLLCAYKKNIPVVYYSVMTLKSKVLDGIKVKKADGTKKTSHEMKMEVQEKVIEIFGKEKFTKKYNDDITDSMSAIVTYYLMNGEPVKTKKELLREQKEAEKQKIKEEKQKEKEELKKEKTLKKKANKKK